MSRRNLIKTELSFFAEKWYNKARTKIKTGGSKMGRPKKYHVVLNEEEVQKIKKMMKKKETCKTLLKRCQILLDLDEAHGK